MPAREDDYGSPNSSVPVCGQSPGGSQEAPKEELILVSTCANPEKTQPLRGWGWGLQNQDPFHSVNSTHLNALVLRKMPPPFGPYTRLRLLGEPTNLG